MGDVVLVHGAWHGAWCWDGVVRALEARGVRANAVELPLTSYGDDVVTARDAIHAAAPGSVVCGHSYGGMVITEAAADAPGVVRLVYLAAFMIEAGEDPLAVMRDHPAPLSEAIVPVDGGYGVDPARIHEVFYGDSDANVAADAAARLRPMPVGDSWLATRAAWTGMPSTYVLCTSDRAISPDAQRVMAARATEVVEWPCDHSPFLTRPDELADLLASHVAH